MDLRKIYIVLLISISLPVGGTIYAQAAYQEQTPIARLGRLSYVDGSVMIKKGDVDEYNSAMINMPIQPADQLQAYNGSRAEIEFDDGSRVRLWERSDLIVAELYSYPDSDAIKSRLALTDGSAYAAISTRNPHSVFILETQAMSLRALTDALVRVDVYSGGVTRIEVYSGEVEVAGGTRMVTLSSNQSTGVTPGMDPKPPQPLRASADSFDRWNREREAYYTAGSKSAEYAPAEITVGLSDLDRYGTWIYDVEYGHVWRPNVQGNWRPYTRGYWHYYEPFGRTWVSTEVWGWVPYHYGSWSYVYRHGWVWVPGAMWGPAWVVWSNYGDYYTWVPVHPWDDYWYRWFFGVYVYAGPYPYYGYYYGAWNDYYPRSYHWPVTHQYHYHEYHHYYHYPDRRPTPVPPELKREYIPLNNDRFYEPGQSPAIHKDMINQRTIHVGKGPNTVLPTQFKAEQVTFEIKQPAGDLLTEHLDRTKPVLNKGDDLVRQTLPQPSDSQVGIRKKADSLVQKYMQAERTIDTPFMHVPARSGRKVATDEVLEAKGSRVQKSGGTVTAGDKISREGRISDTGQISQPEGRISGGSGKITIERGNVKQQTIIKDGVVIQYGTGEKRIEDAEGGTVIYRKGFPQQVLPKQTPGQVQKPGLQQPKRQPTPIVKPQIQPFKPLFPNIVKPRPVQPKPYQVPKKVAPPPKPAKKAPPPKRHKPAPKPQPKKSEDKKSDDKGGKVKK